MDSHVGPYDGEEVVPVGNLGSGVGDGLLWGVEWAGTNDSITTVFGQSSSDIVASGSDGFLRDRRGNNLMAKQGGLGEGFVLGLKLSQKREVWGVVGIRIDAQQPDDNPGCNLGAFLCYLGRVLGRWGVGERKPIPDRLELERYRRCRLACSSRGG